MASFSRTILLFLLFSSVATPEAITFRQCAIKIVNDRNETIGVSVFIARTEKQRSRGLMFRKSLDENRGMLFFFEGDEYLHFWMKNTYIPLSIAYIDSNGTITEILDMEPLDETRAYPSKKPSRYALEMNRGWFRKNGISPGCIVYLHGCIGK